MIHEENIYKTFFDILKLFFLNPKTIDKPKCQTHIKLKIRLGRTPKLPLPQWRQ